MKHSTLTKKLGSLGSILVLTISMLIPTLYIGTANATNPPATLAGANDYGCKPTKAHPYPVILLAGTSNTAELAWPELAPRLKKAGFCVFAPNLGYETINSSLAKQYFKANTYPYRGHIPTTALQLKHYISNILRITKAKKVDIVGHSQGGGVLPRWYMQKLGGAKFVHTLIGIVPVNMGISLTSGENKGLINQFLSVLPLSLKESIITDAMGTAGREQMLGSPLMREYAKLPKYIPGVKLVVIASKYDETNTPWDKATFLHGTNIVLQKVCPNDHASHAVIIHDPVTLDLVQNNLDPQHPRKIVCKAL